jgi:aminoglycoside 2'-N-acetyltransferase I
MPLSFETFESRTLPPRVFEQVRDLCTEAYQEDFSELLPQLGPGVHVLGLLDGVLVSHAMWVTRWLQPAGGGLLRTAYVEAVATKPSQQRRGFARDVLAHLAGEIRDYDLGALSPSDEGFYARLGWEPWRGPLFIRRDGQVDPTPEESVMILRLARTPADLDVTTSLSAEWREGELW